MHDSSMVCEESFIEPENSKRRISNKVSKFEKQKILQKKKQTQKSQQKKNNPEGLFFLLRNIESNCRSYRLTSENPLSKINFLNIIFLKYGNFSLRKASLRTYKNIYICMFSKRNISESERVFALSMTKYMTRISILSQYL